MADSSAFPLQTLLIQLAPVPVVVAFLIGLTRFRRLPPALRYLVGLIGFALVIEVISRLLRMQHRSNLFLMPLDAAGEFWLLVLVYRRALQSASFAKAAPWLIASFTAYVLLDSLLFPEMARFKPSVQIIKHLLVLTLAGLYFRKLLHELRVVQLTREPMFWVSTGLFVYSVGYMQIALFSNYLLRYSKQLNMTIWAINAVLYMMLYCIYSFALWMHPRK
ncbi:hypothetical protein [Hymenobacter arizonensis]|uniref:YhhN-like protein n=1 Tax=Hymenobacter arizonensis TaxID=1227077 RepID=A0A1I5ZPS3_HYMAR|nr:hypothetical protein [Hymenobacter arizonensis]SFQ58451.1 hypothetical protein SAMN04515668_3103 [Hymenobacter arizonensis]